MGQNINLKYKLNIYETDKNFKLSTFIIFTLNNFIQ
tara:strand:+ start:305 stop:412 length:108 start_codon:yes stop_codon:yes gene_type:complete